MEQNSRPDWSLDHPTKTSGQILYYGAPFFSRVLFVDRLGLFSVHLSQVPFLKQDVPVLTKDLIYLFSRRKRDIVRIE